MGVAYRGGASIGPVQAMTLTGPWPAIKLACIEACGRKVTEYGVSGRLQGCGRKVTEFANPHLQAEGYIIWGNVGDQWSDLQGDCVGNRTFKLPNPMYFVP